VSFTAITFCVASQRVIPNVSLYFLCRLNPETFGYTLLQLLSHFYFVASAAPATTTTTTTNNNNNNNNNMLKVRDMKFLMLFLQPPVTYPPQNRSLKIKFPLLLLTKHHTMKTYRGVEV
jgi:hypothetical protein